MSKTTEIILIITAVTIDLLQFGINFLPVGGQIINFFLTILGYTIFFLSFYLNGINIFTKTTVVCSIAEIVPILDSLPTFSAMVIKRVLDLEVNNITFGSLSYLKTKNLSKLSKFKINNKDK